MINNFQKQLKEINEKLDILNEQNAEIKILSTTDVMEILEINRNTANELFKREDFPNSQATTTIRSSNDTVLAILTSKHPRPQPIIILSQSPTSFSEEGQIHQLHFFNAYATFLFRQTHHILIDKVHLFLLNTTTPKKIST